MSRYRDQVAAALRAVAIRGPLSYAWLGRPSRGLSPGLHLDLSPALLRRELVACLREELYWSFYCHGEPVPARWREPEPPSPDPGLLADLSAANTGLGSWEDGWTVRRLDGEVAVVDGPRLRMRVPVGDCSGEVRTGGAVAVRLPKELPARSPGFFTVLGDAATGASGGDVRVYWNVTRAGAPRLVRELSSWLNPAGVPFALKVADHPHRLDRRDAAVLYVEAARFPALRPRLGELAASLRDRLGPGVPAFTLELAPGVGLAEDDSGESFGQRRCAQLADGIVRAHERALTSLGDRVEAVVERFAQDGVRIDAPYLDPALAGRHVL